MIKVLTKDAAYRAGCPVYKAVDKNGHVISVFPALAGMPVISKVFEEIGPLFLEDLFSNPYQPTEHELLQVHRVYGVDLNGIDRILRMPQR